MPYYTRNKDDINCFNEYNPRPYIGGYDMALTYGRPISASEETCYPRSSSANEIDYDYPDFTWYVEPSAYNDDHLQEEYTSYARPKPRPAPNSLGSCPILGGNDEEKKHHHCHHQHEKHCDDE
ncbi:hypothetical protein GH714_031885 [Hevea brasiliensis]|uniref:Uncharacterized protein n=1 Tax=Hevea brasiliensis TaxID=3981 RepID=A0A6A6LIH9_HEVBR|nr:hypothetical protein GH714_031885 [Hevea brasiliensis]